MISLEFIAYRSVIDYYPELSISILAKFDNPFYCLRDPLYPIRQEIF